MCLVLSAFTSKSNLLTRQYKGSAFSFEVRTIPPNILTSSAQTRSRCTLRTVQKTNLIRRFVPLLNSTSHYENIRNGGTAPRVHNPALTGIMVTLTSRPLYPCTHRVGRHHATYRRQNVLPIPGNELLSLPGGWARRIVTTPSPEINKTYDVT
jgi:hypothetical protein